MDTQKRDLINNLTCHLTEDDARAVFKALRPGACKRDQNDYSKPHNLVFFLQNQKWDSLVFCKTLKERGIDTAYVADLVKVLGVSMAEEEDTEGMDEGQEIRAEIARIDAQIQALQKQRVQLLEREVYVTGSDPELARLIRDIRKHVVSKEDVTSLYWALIGQIHPNDAPTAAAFSEKLISEGYARKGSKKSQELLKTFQKSILNLPLDYLRDLKRAVQ